MWVRDTAHTWQRGISLCHLAGSPLGLASGYGPDRSSMPAMPGSIRSAMRRA